MEAKDIISVESATEWLNAEDTTPLDRLIRSAVNWVETYTGHKLFQREVVLKPNAYGYTDYPIEISAVENALGESMPYRLQYTPNRLFVHSYNGTKIKALVGYSSLEEVPPILVEAAYKMLTYLYENKDIYPIDVPTDIKLMINKYRRNLI